MNTESRQTGTNVAGQVALLLLTENALPFSPHRPASGSVPQTFDYEIGDAETVTRKMLMTSSTISTAIIGATSLCHHLKRTKKTHAADLSTVIFALKTKHNLSIPQQHHETTAVKLYSTPSRPVAVSAVTGAESSVVDDDDTANLLDEVQVFDLDGNAIPISELWKNRKAVVAFARHFGCVLCRRRADFLAAEKERMDASGVALILIGPGSVEQARTFYEQTKFKGEVYADPSHASYKALQFAYGVFSTFTPKAGLKIIQSYMEGYRQDWALSSEKDTVARGGWQQGGILVAGPGKNNITYIHRDKEAGDDPDIQEILKACCS